MEHKYDNSIVYNADCMEIMRDIPDGYFDLAVVDPPYGLDLANMNMGVGKSKKASKIKNRKWIAKDWDKSVPTEDYFIELYRISVNQIIFGGNYFDLKPCKNYIIWDKEIPEGLSFADCEMAWTSFGKSPRIFRYSAYLDKKSKKHPTQKPIALYDWIYANYLPQGGKVFDSHLGSQSNRISAYKRGNIDFTACELDKDYFNDGNARFMEFVKKYQPAHLEPITANGQNKLF